MAVLGLLAEVPRHGYDIKRAYDEHFPQARPLAFGQVYATLSRLGRDGLIDVVHRDGDAGPERTTYDLTAQGRDRLGAWLAEPEPPAPYVANLLFTKVVVALLTKADADGYLQRQRSAHLGRMRELTALKTAENATTTDRVSADFALNHLDADLRWIDDTAARLGALAREITGHDIIGSSR